MEAVTAKEWFLRKYADSTVFGPLSFEQLARWASAAQIAPHDSVSNDQETWMKAPMLPELQMDWLVEITTESYYGPTTLGAIQEFIRLGEIDGDNAIINSCDGTRKRIRELPLVLQTSVGQRADGSGGEFEHTKAPTPTGMAVNAHDRIRNLEQTLREERRALREAEERCRLLDSRCAELQARSLNEPFA